MLFFLLFGLTILWFLYRDLNASYLAECVSKGIPEAECSLVDKVIADFRATHIFWLIVICFCFFLSNVSRSLRWQQLIQSMGYNTKWANAFHCVMLGYFANLGLPRMGEVIRAATFTRYEVIPFEKVMGTVVVDRIIDLICLSLVFLLALLLQFDLLWQFIVDNANFSFSDVLFSPLFLIAFIALLILLILGWNYRSRLAGISFFNGCSGLPVALQKVSSHCERLRISPD